MAFLAVTLFAAILLQQPADSLPDAQPGNVHGQVKTRVVATKYGRVQGYITRVGRDAQQQRHVEMYLGVPYASPPSGNYRFSPTRPPVHWSGIRSSVDHGPACPQAMPDVSNMTEALGRMPMSRVEFLRKIRPKLSHQSEDCLYLNIYVPAKDEAHLTGVDSEEEEDDDPDRPRLYPVMVFVHGESFSWGSGNLYDGRVLATYGKLIVVTFNYRLGVFGFLNTNISPGRKPRMANYGLMDQIAALKWIQENIQQFGGDPKSVTLFGHNRGAACIHYLMQSPVVVPDLFHRAVMMSGSAYSDWAMVEDPVHYSVQLASHFNCSIPRNMLRDHEDILRCLRGKPVEELAHFHYDTPSFLTAMGPSRDGVLIPADFGADVLAQIRKRAQSGTYQVLLGMVQDETDVFFSDEETVEGIGPGTRDRYLRTLVRNTFSYHLNEIFATVQNEYTDWTWQSSAGPGGDAPIRPRHLQWSASKALTDKLYVAPIVLTANWCNQSGFPTYLYIYGYADTVTKLTVDPGLRRSVHGTMVPLIFGLPFAPELPSAHPPFTSQEASLAQTIVTYWSNFATSGHPNQPYTVQNLFGRPSAGKSFRQWDPYIMESQKYLQLDSVSTMQHHPRLHSMSVWLHLIPKLHTAGANNIFPAHNAFLGHDDPSLFAGVVRPSSFSHGYQVNREYLGGTTPAPPLTTCIPVSSHRDHDGTGIHEADSFVRLEKASVQAYKQAMYLTVGIGALLLGVNVWFLLCLFFCRSRIACCVEATTSNGIGMGNKDTSVETELIGIGNESMQSIRDHVVSSAPRRSHSQSSIPGQSLRSATPEALRLLQQASHAQPQSDNSDRDSRSTSSQSHCGHNNQQQSSKYRQVNGGISFIAPSDETRQHQMAVALALANTEQVYAMQQHHSGRSGAASIHSNHNHRSSATLPRKPAASSSASSGSGGSRPPSQMESHTLGSNRGGNNRLQHTGGSNCRMHETNGNSSGCRLHKSTNSSSSPKSNSSSNPSSQGVSIILPPPPPSTSTTIEQQTSSSGGLTSTIKRNPSSKPKLTTFCSPEAQIMGSPVMPKRSPPEMLNSSQTVMVTSPSDPNETTSILHHRRSTTT